MERVKNYAGTPKSRTDSNYFLQLHREKRVSSLILFGHLFAQTTMTTHVHTHTQPPGCLPVYVCVCVCATLFVLWARPPLGPSATLQPTFCRSAVNALLETSQWHSESTEQASSLLFSPSSLPPPSTACHCVCISCSIVNGLQYSIFTAQHVDGCQIRAQMGETPFKKDFIDLAYELPTKTNGAANSPLSRQAPAPFPLPFHLCQKSL